MRSTESFTCVRHHASGAAISVSIGPGWNRYGPLSAA